MKKIEKKVNVDKLSKMDKDFKKAMKKKKKKNIFDEIKIEEIIEESKKETKDEKVPEFLKKILKEKKPYKNVSSYWDWKQGKRPEHCINPKWHEGRMNRFKYVKGLINPEFEEYLKDLKTTNIDLYTFNFPYDCPSFCNISLTTTLQRIFLAGINLLKTFNSYIQSKNFDFAKQFLKLQDGCWDSYFENASNRYSFNLNNKEEIDFNRNIVRYLLNDVNLQEFPEKWNKYIYSTYERYHKKKPFLKDNNY